jgi:hypothetical protein
MKLLCSFFVAFYLFPLGGFAFIGIESDVKTDHQHLLVLKLIKKAETRSMFDSESDDGTAHKHKKRNRKGVKPLFICISSDINCKTNTVNNKVNLLSQPFYFFCVFPGNGKRGPPSSQL